MCVCVCVCLCVCVCVCVQALPRVSSESAVMATLMPVSYDQRP